MTVGSRGPALQDSSGKRQEWISSQLQPLKLTDTSMKLSVYVFFQRRVQIVFHMFGNSNGLHFLNNLRHGDLDGFSSVLLNQFSTTKSKSTLIPGSKFKFSPKPLLSLLPSKISTTNQMINMDSQHTLSEFQEQVTQRNRQRLLSTWLAHRQGKHLSQDWTQGESKHTGPFAVTQNQLVEVPSEGCVDEAIDCLSQSQHIFRSQIQPTFQIRRWINVQRIAPFVGGIGITTQESCLQVSTVQQMSLIYNSLQNG